MAQLLLELKSLARKLALNKSFDTEDEPRESNQSHDAADAADAAQWTHKHGGTSNTSPPSAATFCEFCRPPSSRSKQQPTFQNSNICRSCTNTESLAPLFKIDFSAIHIDSMFAFTDEQDAAGKRYEDQTMLNFRELLWYWQEYYLRRGRDRLSVEFSCRIPFSSWSSLVELLCRDDGQPTSLLSTAATNLRLSPYHRPPRINATVSVDVFNHSKYMSP